ncbi:nickel-dependent lactate racemase [Candidatus Bathyarchaeota archaeon]|nr:nickel-dependent lactate racemase [Candidatus Bathyarchaeota archaeon]
MSFQEILLPYGKSTIKVKVPKENLIGVIEPRDLPPVKDPIEAVKEAVSHPILGPRLSEIAKSGDKVAIVVTDITRRCPDNILMPVILSELKKGGVRAEDITAVIALGIHRPMTQEEIRTKIGEEAFRRVRTINHNCRDKSQMVYIGKTRRLNIPVWINKIVAEADVVVTTGVVEAHVFAGYSGGRKSIIPGVSGEEAIAAVHRPEWLDDPQVGTGIIKGNPVHEDMVELARLVGVDFIVNVVLNSQDKIVQAAAGDLIAAHEKLIATYDKMYKVEIHEKADIVISSPAYPKDINLYQATRAANNIVLVPNPPVKKGGIVIIPAPCQDGVGDELFYEWMKTAENPSEVLERAKREYKIGVHKPYLLSKILSHAGVIVANSVLPADLIREMHLTPAKTVDEGLEIAFKKLGGDARILICPHGISTIPIMVSSKRGENSS